jgi:predicted 3-demethylubiquinone-9 3-methyltransferase (glyoxalase superfamily)
MPKVTPFLWFESGAREAFELYASVFEVAAVPQGEGPGFFMGSIALPGTELQLFEGGPHHAFNDAISLFVTVETQQEVDRLWQALSEGGEPGRCGWLKDRFGVSWQIVPSALGELLGDPDPERSGRVREAMLAMGKLDLAGLRAAHAG